MSSAKAVQAVTGSVRKLCLNGGEALKPQFVNQKWRKPALSARQAARIRKTALIDGTYGSFDKETGMGWDPVWDKPGKIGRIQRPKESKRERTREMRAQRIEALMEGMDMKVEQHREELGKRKPTPGIETYIKQVALRKR